MVRQKTRSLTTDAAPSWAYLTNHAHVVLCIAADPSARLREIADRIGITERAVQNIITELERSGVVHKERTGRRNSYRLNGAASLRHPLEAHRTIDALVDMVRGAGRNGQLGALNLGEQLQL